jgi:hypothetical protein
VVTSLTTQLVDEQGEEISVQQFGHGFTWDAGDLVDLGSGRRYRVLSVDYPEDELVRLVVERVGAA